MKQLDEHEKLSMLKLSLIPMLPKVSLYCVVLLLITNKQWVGTIVTQLEIIGRHLFPRRVTKATQPTTLTPACTYAP